jgi:hypothetical protein
MTPAKNCPIHPGNIQKGNTMATRRTFRGNADPISTLIDILVATPDEFNSDKDKLRGRAETRPMGSRLNGVDYDTFMSHRAQGRITYVIYSYNTPIAWRIYSYGAMVGETFRNVSTNLEQHWVMASTSGGTVTTAKHMNRVATALRQISGGI